MNVKRALEILDGRRVDGNGTPYAQGFLEAVKATAPLLAKFKVLRGALKDLLVGERQTPEWFSKTALLLNDAQAIEDAYRKGTLGES